MKRIVYLGSAFAGKGENLRALERIVGGRLLSSGPRGADGRVLSLETQSVHGAVVASTVPGFVYKDAVRRELVASADAIVFVTDGRAARFYQTLEAWESIGDLLDGRPLPPMVIQHNFRDDADATPIDALEDALDARGLLSIVPYRFQAIATIGSGVRETFDAAVHVAQFGYPKPHQSDARIATPMEALVDKLEDPDFVDDMIALAEASILHDVTCPTCKHVQPHFEIAFQSPGAEGPFRVGQPLPVDAARIDPELYFHLHRYSGKGQMLVLDAQRCPQCETIVWLGVALQDGKLAGVWPVPLTRSTLAKCHYATSGIAFEAARLVGRPVDDILPYALPILNERLAP